MFEIPAKSDKQASTFCGEREKVKTVKTPTKKVNKSALRQEMSENALKPECKPPKKKQPRSTLYCFVPGCEIRTPTTPADSFYDFPRVDPSNEKNYSLITLRRRAWVTAINLHSCPDALLDQAKICHKHFVSGRPSRDKWFNDQDWVPSVNLIPKHALDYETNCDLKRKYNALLEIIENLPEVDVKFDAPDYVLLDQTRFDEKQIEADIVKKYLSSPQKDHKGCYTDDHDYLGLPFRSFSLEGDLSFDHNYSISGLPACCLQDWRYFCNICAHNCPTLFLLNNHLMQHTLSNSVDCEFCYASFFTTTCLHNHLASHTALCDVCGNEVPLQQLPAHKKVNKKQKIELVQPSLYKLVRVYFCVFCMVKFREKDQYLVHMEKHKKRNLKKKAFVKVA